VGAETGQDVLYERKFSLPYRNLKPEPSVPWSRHHTPASPIFMVKNDNL
jgi:hypothetical protein